MIRRGSTAFVSLCLRIELSSDNFLRLIICFPPLACVLEI
jgi:hypothetical protein